MGFQSQAGHVGFRTQTSKGVFANPGTGGVFMRTRSGGLSGDRELLIPEAEIGGNRDVPDAYLGPIRFVGDFEFYARLESLATLLYGALGTKQSTTNSPETGAHTHVITPTDGALPWLSVEEKVGNGYEAFRYTDAKVNTLHLEADSTGYLMGTVGIVALSQQPISGASVTANPDFDTSPMIVGSNITVEWGGAQLPAKSFSFDVSNNLEDDDFRLGSLFLGDATEKRREFTMGVRLRPEDSDLWRTAMYGDPNAVVAGGTVTKEDVLLTCETYEFIGSTATVSTLQIAVPVATLVPFSVTPSGDDVIEHDVEIRLLRPDPAFDIVEATVINGLTSVA